MFSKSSLNPKAWVFVVVVVVVFATWINQLISHWQKYVDYQTIPILINKDVFKPSYKDLNFRV